MCLEVGLDGSHQWIPVNRIGPQGWAPQNYKIENSCPLYIKVEGYKRTPLLLEGHLPARGPSHYIVPLLLEGPIAT